MTTCAFSKSYNSTSDPINANTDYNTAYTIYAYVKSKNNYANGISIRFKLETSSSTGYAFTAAPI